MNNNVLKHSILGVIGGALLTVIIIYLFQSIGNNIGDSNKTNDDGGEAKVLYWVAPMDPNYQRDKPGKSPMGMDLIPVYAKEESLASEGPGTIKISPIVINNLGVRTSKVKRGSLNTTINTVGYLKYNEEKFIHIHPRVKGWIEHLYVKASGNLVQKGQPLYDIYAPELVNAQEELLLALERKNKRLIQASKDRLKALQLPQHTLKELLKTRKVKQMITFYAPQDGVVDNLHIRQGFYVKPGTTMMSIGTLDDIWVDVEVFERQAFQMVKGLNASMTLDFIPGKKWQGKVNYVYPTLDKKTHTVKLRLQFDNLQHELKPNMFAQVAIEVPMEDNLLLVPREAVIRSGHSERVVLNLGEGQFKSIIVKLGRFDDDFIEILSGLEEGVSIVTSAQFLLDSESSKTSDFKRMNQIEKEKDTKVASVWVEARINEVITDSRKINVHHEAIDEWDWPDMTMDFQVAETVDFSLLKIELNLHIEITKTGAYEYQVTDIHIPEQIEDDTDSTLASNEKQSNNQSVWVKAKINTVSIDERKVNVDHGVIENWGWPEMRMDFLVADAIDPALLKVGLTLNIEIVKNEKGQYLIVAIRDLEDEANNAESIPDNQNATHSQHDH